MPSYCKAYQVKDIQGFPGWGGADVQGLSDDDICYIWSDFSVTKSCLGEKEKGLLEVTPEWKEFCTGSLKFEVPADLKDDRDQGD